MTLSDVNNATSTKSMSDRTVSDRIGSDRIGSDRIGSDCSFRFAIFDPLIGSNTRIIVLGSVPRNKFALPDWLT